MSKYYLKNKIQKNIFNKVIFINKMEINNI